MQNNLQDLYDSETSEIEDQIIETEPEEEPAAQLEQVEEPQKIDLLGVVVDCKKLNVREAPFRNANILAVIPVGSEVVVDPKTSTDEFYKICNAAGIQGFCMKQFIMLRN